MHGRDKELSRCGFKTSQSLTSRTFITDLSTNAPVGRAYSNKSSNVGLFSSIIKSGPYNFVPLVRFRILSVGRGYFGTKVKK